MDFFLIKNSSLFSAFFPVIAFLNDWHEFNPKNIMINNKYNILLAIILRSSTVKKNFIKNKAYNT